MTWSVRIGVSIVRAYQVLLGPLLGGSCRFEPSCSHYAANAIETHGLFHGAWLSVRRVARCHPFSSAGFDPVPPRSDGR